MPIATQAAYKKSLTKTPQFSNPKHLKACWSLINNIKIMQKNPYIYKKIIVT